MDVFGELWRDHPRRLAEGWDAVVGAEDVVLVVGDISWARNAEEVGPDLEFLAARSGRLKVLLKGNHDSWWKSAGKVRSLLPPGLTIIHHDAQRLEEGVVLCGARGWSLPTMPWADSEKDPPIYRRELERLALSLAAARRLSQPGDLWLALLHYPPLGPRGNSHRDTSSEVLEMLSEAGVAAAAYGHLHGLDHAWAPRGMYQGIELRFVAADYTGFVPRPIWDSRRGVIPEP